MRLPFGTITITQKAKEFVLNALNEKRVSNGRLVREFEEKFAELLGVKEAVALSSGSDADTLALAALHDLGARRGDEVLVPVLSFVATGNAVLHSGLIPVFVDIEPETLNIDSKKIEEKITPKTRAIMPVHLMGKPAAMDEINELAQRHGLYVIEDAAEAHGGQYKGKNLGTLGHMGAFSLYVAHIISTVEGGIVVTNDSHFAQLIRSLRSHGRACSCPVCTLNTSSGYCAKRFKYGQEDIRFMFERIGYSSKMNELEAAVGLGSLELYSEIMAKRRENLLYLIKEFGRFSEFMYTLEELPYEKIGPYAFPFIVRPGAPFTRNELGAFLENKGVDTRTLFNSMPTQCPGFAFLGHQLGAFPNAEYIGLNGLHIGVHQELSQEHLDYFLSLVETFIAQR